MAEILDYCGKPGNKNCFNIVELPDNKKYIFSPMYRVCISECFLQIQELAVRHRVQKTGKSQDNALLFRPNCRPLLDFL